MSSRLFWKLLLIYSSLHVITMVVVVWAVTRLYESNEREQNLRRLQASATVVQQLLADASTSVDGGGVVSSQLEEMLKRWGEDSDVHVSVMGSDGSVLAETPRSNRSASRTSPLPFPYSSGFGSDDLQFVMPWSADSDARDRGTIRVSIRPEDIQRSLNSIRWRVWSVAGAASLLLLLATSAVVARIVDPVTQLTSAVESIAAGDYTNAVYASTYDEIGKLAQAFNGMRQQMETRMSQLGSTNERLSTILGGMNDGVIAIDHQQRVLFANRAAGRLMMFAPREVQGESLLKVIRSHRLHDLTSRLLTRGGQQQIEMEWGDDDPQHLLVNATTLTGKPSPGIVMVIHNLTELRKLEAMRRDFVANVSHELKTPLSSIKAYAETLSAGAIRDEANRDRFVREIEEQADRLHQLISDLLSLARIESGHQQFEWLVLPVQHVIELCVREQKRAAEAKELTLNMVPGEEAYVRVDEDALRQVLINLVDNAIKYTPEQGKVEVGWSKGDGWVEIQVRDTGIGIPEEMQNRVFERFFRVDKARSRELGGTGLGLAIVKHLVQSLGGTIRVESTLGKGSCFAVRLPLAGGEAG